MSDIENSYENWHATQLIPFYRFFFVFIMNAGRIYHSSLMSDESSVNPIVYENQIGRRTILFLMRKTNIFLNKFLIVYDYAAWIWIYWIESSLVYLIDLMRIFFHLFYCLSISCVVCFKSNVYFNTLTNCFLQLDTVQWIRIY